MRTNKKSCKKTYKKKIYNKINYIPEIYKNITALINIDDIKHNIDFLRKISGTDIMPILKADAYGHGIIEMAKIMRKLKIKYIGVATLGEAIMLRKNGDKGRILAWLYNINGCEILESFKLNIDIAIYDETIITKFIGLIPNNKKINVTIFVDTGINRAGVPYNKAFDIFKLLINNPKINLEGMMSHLVCSNIKNSPIVNEQLRKFRELRKNLENIGIKPPLVHIANTSACINYDVSDFTLARCGSGICGISDNFTLNKKLKLPMTIKTQIIQIKDVNKGEGIGYNWEYITPCKMKISILPIGWADLIPQNTSLKLHVFINGIKRKVLGQISMDQIVIEADINDKINDEVYIFGNGVNCRQTIYDISKLSNSSPLEILSHIGYRVNRIYI
jgi:alanine racemase